MQIFELPTWITMAIAATRMHRALVDSASSATDVYVYDVLHSLAFRLIVVDLVLAYPGIDETVISQLKRRSGSMPRQSRRMGRS